MIAVALSAGLTQFAFLTVTPKLRTKGKKAGVNRRPKDGYSDHAETRRKFPGWRILRFLIRARRAKREATRGWKGEPLSSESRRTGVSGRSVRRPLPL